MNVAVCIPWRETPERSRAYLWVVERWRRITGWPVVSEDSPTSYWSKAVAGNRTVDRALVEHAPDVLFVVDADLVLLNPQSVAERALRDGWAVGHDRLLRLSESASDRLLASAPDVEVREEDFGRDRAGRKEVKRTVPALLGDTALAITPNAWEHIGGVRRTLQRVGRSAGLGRSRGSGASRGDRATEPSRLPLLARSYHLQEQVRSPLLQGE